MLDEGDKPANDSVAPPWSACLQEDLEGQCCSPTHPCPATACVLFVDSTAAPTCFWLQDRHVTRTWRPCGVTVVVQFHPRFVQKSGTEENRVLWTVDRRFTGGLMTIARWTGKVLTLHNTRWEWLIWPTGSHGICHSTGSSFYLPEYSWILVHNDT